MTLACCRQYGAEMEDDFGEYILPLCKVLSHFIANKEVEVLI